MVVIIVVVVCSSSNSSKLMMCVREKVKKKVGLYFMLALFNVCMYIYHTCTYTSAC